MANFENTLTTLTADQQNIIKEEIERREGVVRDGVKDDAEKAVRKAKEEFKSAVQSVRKPETFTSGKDIRLFMDTFDSYTKSINLAEDKSKQSFLTYLDPESFQKIKVLEILNINDWKQFRDAVIEALSPAMSKMAIKQKLRNLRQRPNEKVTEFYDRIIVLASQYFEDNVTDAEKSTILKETLAAGLRDDQISVELIERDKWDFKRCLDYAVRREQSVMARKEITGDDKEHLTILNVAGTSGDAVQKPENRQVQTIQGSQTLNRGAPMDLRCHNCNERGHFFRDCPTPQTCFHCHKPGHIRKECYTLQNASNKQGAQSIKRFNGSPNNNTKGLGPSNSGFRQNYRSQIPNRSMGPRYNQSGQGRGTFNNRSQDYRQNNNRGFTNLNKDNTNRNFPNENKKNETFPKNGQTPL